MAKRLYVEKVSELKKALEKKRFSDKQLEVTVVERGIVLPARMKTKRKVDGYEGGVCDNDFNFVAGYERRPPPSKDESKGGNLLATVNSAYVVAREELVELDEDVIFGGVLLRHFGHFIMEGWNRLWYVLQNPELKSKILFLLTRGGYQSWYDDFFSLMGIDNERIIYVEKPMQCRSVTVPEQSQYASGMFMKEFLIPYQTIKSNVKLNAGGVMKKYT